MCPGGKKTNEKPSKRRHGFHFSPFRSPSYILDLEKSQPCGSTMDNDTTNAQDYTKTTYQYIVILTNTGYVGSIELHPLNPSSSVNLGAILEESLT